MKQILFSPALIAASPLAAAPVRARNDTAKAFLEFLSSPAGRTILEKWGWK